VRIVVTGAGGGLGRAFLEVVPSHHDVVPLAHVDLDIGDHASVMQKVPSLRPDVVMNLAAFTKVDANEADPARAFRDNAQGSHSLALAARDSGAILLHVSTDYVFDGEKGSPYDETDRPNPLSVYGRSKLAAERFVRHTLPEHFIVRTGFVYGGGSDHLTSQIARLREGEEAFGVADRIGSLTYVRDLAARLVPLVLTHRFGTYHLAGPTPTSWFEALERCKELGDLAGTITAQRAADLELPAPRPRDSSMVSVFVENLSLPPFPSLDQSLTDLLGR
jgi:dTDP-4-dehydrorhamnose reductase